MRFADVQVKPDRWICFVDARSGAGVVAKAVYDRVLGSLYPVVRREGAPGRLGRPDCKRLPSVEMLPPSDLTERVIQRRVVAGIELDERKQHPRGNAGPQAQPIPLLQRPSCMNGGRAHIDDLEVQAPHFFGKHFLATFRARKHPSKSLRGLNEASPTPLAAASSSYRRLRGPAARRVARRPNRRTKQTRRSEVLKKWCAHARRCHRPTRSVRPPLHR